MARYDNYDDDDDDDFGGPTDDFNTLRKADRAKAKRIKELEAELNTYRVEGRKRALAGAIESKGLNPKIAALVPADLGPDEISDWLDEFGDIFAPPSAATAESGEPEPTSTPAPDGADVFSRVASTGSAPVGDEGQLMALIKGAASKEELDRLIFGL